MNTNSALNQDQELKSQRSRARYRVDLASRFSPGAHSALSDALKAFIFSLSEGTSVFRKDGYSIYRFQNAGRELTEIGFAPLLAGGFVLRKAVTVEGVRKEWYEKFGEDGNLSEVRQTLDEPVLFVDLIDMEPLCPILSHLYDTLSYEYAQAGTGHAKLKGVLWMENFLRELADDSHVPLSVHGLSRDAAIVAYRAQELQTEQNPVLTWEERQQHIQRLRAERARIILVKRRVHRLSGLQMKLPVMMDDLVSFVRRIKMRPGSNARGILYRYTIGMLLWFLHTVRSNIGYSVALAIYGPFTFYFITQPLNPHAMWAVGRVRSAYLDTIESIKTATGLGAAATTTAAVAVATVSNDKIIPEVRRLGMPLSTDSPAVDGQAWTDRMGRFKDMQIGYEEHMQFAARMGRLEQMETQLNFPLIAQSSWLALERYVAELNEAKARLGQSTTASPALVTYLDREIIRTRRLELYVWDKLLRFVLDHPYVVMDQGSDQSYRDAYLGRVFVLLQEITEGLAAAKVDFERPSETKKLEKLAALYRKSKVQDGSILTRVERNSKALPKKGSLDGADLRGQLKRHWEVLYLLQNKAQEASNFGLQTYTWSVRNTVWLLAALHAAKSREMALLLNSSGNLPEAALKEVKTAIEPEYESLYHLALVEYLSIEPELAKNLTYDLESVQRQEVIETIREFLRDRDVLMAEMAKTK